MMHIVTPVTWIWEVPTLNINQGTDYPDLGVSWFPSVALDKFQDSTLN